MDKQYRITREEAIQILADLIDSPFLHTWEKQNKALHMAIEALSADRLQCEWINSTTKGYVVCSNCNKLTTNINRKKYNYCPFCGARMKGGAE